MNISRNPKAAIILNGVTATGVGANVQGEKHKDCIITVSTANSASCTIKCKIAYGSVAPNFGAAASPTNNWSYAELIELGGDDANIPGSTGIVLTGTDICKSYEVNTNGFDYMTLDVTARAAGTITAKARLYNNA